MPTEDAPHWLKAAYGLWVLFIVVGVPTFLFGVPSALNSIARALHRIADAKEEKKEDQ